MRFNNDGFNVSGFNVSGEDVTISVYASDDLLITLGEITQKSFQSSDELKVKIEETGTQRTFRSLDTLKVKISDVAQPLTKLLTRTDELKVTLTEATKRYFQSEDELLVTLGEDPVKKIFGTDELKVKIEETGTQRTFRRTDTLKVKISEARTLLKNSPVKTDEIKVTLGETTRRTFRCEDELKVQIEEASVAPVVRVYSSDTLKVKLEDATLRSFMRTDELKVSVNEGSRREFSSQDALLVVVTEGTPIFGILVRASDTLKVKITETSTLPVHQTRVTYLKTPIKKTETLYTPLEEEGEEP